ncbi:class I SAM-dependent methyltransferase [Aliigemmobacter aestuarii]|uniref:Class I SAM-dependent methyltransferase n=1 Tax=Aliigemmobacter aestuarii TaxID=1445661 RepID=A0A4S3MME5_9RHOB|nr:methyltransferase [Gemmobacter aestuarii]THD83469.1 class I SAM-dependent methyltransferase [Gemmobacter aestuarii]
MRSTRLSLALETGALALPATGALAVYGPHDADDMAAFDKTRVKAVQGHFPDHRRLSAMGFDMAAEGPVEGASAAVVMLPRSKEQARAMLAEAAASLPHGAPVIVDGFKTDGVEGVLRDLRARLPVTEPISKAHGKTFAFVAGPELADWTAMPREVEGGFRTVPGVFSADGPDRGSVLLAAALPDYLPGYSVDLGAGWGFLSRAVLARKGVKRLDLVEADHAALTCARVNVTDPRARFYWADATEYRADGHADHVICNPPFHAGRDADPALGVAFLRAAAGMLSPEGDLWLVANRHLPYDRALKELFQDVAEIGGDSAFRLTRAARPIRRRR